MSLFYCLVYFSTLLNSASRKWIPGRDRDDARRYDELRLALKWAATDDGRCDRCCLCGARRWLPEPNTDYQASSEQWRSDRCWSSKSG